MTRDDVMGIIKQMPSSNVMNYIFNNKKGKGFEKIADKAAKKYGSKEKGQKVAAAAMWKNIKRENTEVKNWVKGLVENEKFHNFTSKGQIMELIKTKLTEEEAREVLQTLIDDVDDFEGMPSGDYCKS